MSHRKRKNQRFLNTTRVFYIHVTLYVVLMLGFWYTYVNEIWHPNNANTSLAGWADASAVRFKIGFVWAFILLGHFMYLQFHNWREKRRTAEVDENIRWDETEFNQANRRLQTEPDDETDDYRPATQQSLGGVAP